MRKGLQTDKCGLVRASLRMWIKVGNRMRLAAHRNSFVFSDRCATISFVCISNLVGHFINDLPLCICRLFNSVRCTLIEWPSCRSTGSCASDAHSHFIISRNFSRNCTNAFVYFCVRLHQLDDAFICHNRFCGDARSASSLSNPIKMHENTTHRAHVPFYSIDQWFSGKLINVLRKSENRPNRKRVSVRNAWTTDREREREIVFRLSPN